MEEEGIENQKKENQKKENQKKENQVNYIKLYKIIYSLGRQSHLEKMRHLHGQSVN